VGRVRPDRGLDVAGAFGQGFLAIGHAATSDASMNVEYNRLARYSTPSVVTIKFGENAIRNGAVKMWASDTLLKGLGMQHLEPAPLSTTLDGTGDLYTYASTPVPNSIQFALQPRSIGWQSVTLRLENGDQLTLRILVLP
jgi:hypothetical protein